MYKARKNREEVDNVAMRMDECALNIFIVHPMNKRQTRKIDNNSNNNTAVAVAAAAVAAEKKRRRRNNKCERQRVVCVNGSGRDTAQHPVRRRVSDALAIRHTERCEHFSNAVILYKG